METFKEWLAREGLFTKDDNGPKFSVNTGTAPALNQGCAGGPGKCPPAAGGGAGASPAPGPKKSKKQSKKQ